MGFDMRWSDKLKIASTLLEKIMSVSMSDTPAFASSPTDLSQIHSKPDTKAGRPAPVVNTAANVGFVPHEGQGGPVFGKHYPSTGRHLPAEHLAPNLSAPALSSFMDAFKHWMSQWFSGHRPPMGPGYHRPPAKPDPACSHAPSRPNPHGEKPYPNPIGKPHPHYARKTNEQLAQQLQRHFNAFSDPLKPGYVSADSIYAMAKKGWSFDPVTNANIRLANELLRRPELMSALDRNTSTGALDGLIDRQNVNVVIKGKNAFKYKTDKQLAGEMLKHFNALKSNSWDGQLSFNELRGLAAQRPSGNASKDHVIQLAQEILKRSDVLTIMDNLAGRDGDGRISWRALYLLSR